MTEPWTPGPWRVGGPAPRPWVFVNESGAAWIANYHHPVDARLIAAAPEMAALLQAWADEHDHTDVIDDDTTCEMTRALLARIRGEGA